ncbi:MAG: 2-oxo acid dehydrogenase subunit E2 [Fimbriimonadaceae bacterium]|nr:2-oxo acid dehydrogenase subunit E2 [Fimbriimonadaceae bacterium]
MSQQPLLIPQIGEGLQEARVVAFLKQPGDRIKRDEPIYQMETDKAVMDVESPYDGVLVAWTAKVDDVVPIGGEVGMMETSAAANVAPESAPTKPEAQAQSTNGEISLRIPQIGEGLQEARVVALLKQPGEAVKRDEAIYQMETDKAVMDVESPYSGTVVRWLANVDDVLAIGAEVLVMSTTEAVQEAAPEQSATTSAVAAPVASPASTPSGERRRDIPPRTRAYAKKLGISDADLATIPASGKMLMPDDLDQWQKSGAASVATPVAKSSTGKAFSEKPFDSKQRVLASRLQRGNQLVVPGMMSIVTNWGPLESLRQEVKDSGAEFAPSAFTYFAFAVARAAIENPIVRSTLVGDATVRTYDHLQLGIAVALPGDALVVAVVPDSDALSWEAFASTARERINLAREGKDQADESVTLSITNMQAYNIREAMAVVVPPGVATIFLGEPYNGLANDSAELKLQRCANVGITIDHRLINGVGGAEFLNAIKQNVENIRELVKS